MKFTCLIASTLLIIFISQHSTIGLPIDDVTTERTCLKGFELVDGQCLRIKSESDKTDLENVTMKNIESAKEDKPIIYGACSEGKVHGKHGICEDIVPEDKLATTIEPKEVHDTPVEHEKEHVEHEKEHVEHEKEHVEHEKEPLEYTTGSIEVTSPLSDVSGASSDTSYGKSHEEDIPKGCPPGTKPDEQGACQDEVESSSKIPAAGDFKGFLSKDGSCPFGMELFNDKCVYIKSKQSLKLRPLYSYDDYLPKNTGDLDNKEELVPVLADNSCPEDTEYYSNGLCRKTIRSSNTHAISSTNDLCPVGELLVDGECKPMKTESQSPVDVTTDVSRASDVTSEKEPSTVDEEKLVKHIEKSTDLKSKRAHL